MQIWREYHSPSASFSVRTTEERRALEYSQSGRRRFWHLTDIRLLMKKAKTYQEVIGETVEHMRLERGWTQEELAEAVGTTRQTITSIEVGKYTASLPLAYKIARYFGLTIEEVFDFSDLEE